MRAGGEALSIRQMIDEVIRQEDIDHEQIFVTGLSSGGAMAAVMLATYPEIFAGGAIIAGLPYGSASGVLQAMDRMSGLGGPSSGALEASLRGASRHGGPWPILSIWHGSADRTVDASNVAGIAAQWQALHGVSATDARSDMVDGFPRLAWVDSEGREVLEIYSITGMGHGTPLQTHGADALGVIGAYMLEAKISSTRHIARFWGLGGNSQDARQLARGSGTG